MSLIFTITEYFDALLVLTNIKQQLLFTCLIILAILPSISSCFSFKRLTSCILLSNCVLSFSDDNWWASCYMREKEWKIKWNNEWINEWGWMSNEWYKYEFHTNSFHGRSLTFPFHFLYSNNKVFLSYKRERKKRRIVNIMTILTVSFYLTKTKPL